MVSGLGVGVAISGSSGTPARGCQSLASSTLEASGGVLDLGSGQDLMVAATVAWSFTGSTIVGLAGHLIKITAGCRSA